MKPHDKRRAVEAGEREFGYDFFMVDPRGGVSAVAVMAPIVVAAPFRIQSETDVACFVNFASPFIPWVASKNACYQPKAMAKTAGVM